MRAVSEVPCPKSIQLLDLGQGVTAIGVSRSVKTEGVLTCYEFRLAQAALCRKMLDIVRYLAILPINKADQSISNSMDTKTRQKYEARAHIIKAMAHPSRLFIVDELSKGERCVCELRDMIGVDISTVSKHLSILKDAGIVEDDKRGLQVWYRLKVPCILNFFGCVENVLKANARQAVAAAKR